MELKSEAQTRERRQKMKNKGAAGLGWGLGVLFAIEVLGRALADGYPDAEWRGWVLALGGTAAALAGYIRSSGGLLAALFAVGLLNQGCATTYKGALGGTAFAPGYTSEQCAVLKKERRTYEATREASSYVAGAGLACGLFTVALTDSKTATGICAGVGAAAEGTSIFTASQVRSLDEELAQGGCSR